MYLSEQAPLPERPPSKPKATRRLFEDTPPPKPKKGQGVRVPEAKSEPKVLPREKKILELCCDPPGRSRRRAAVLSENAVRGKRKRENAFVTLGSCHSFVPQRPPTTS